MANYSISANVFYLFAMSSQGKTQGEEKRKKKKKKRKKKKKTFKPRARNNNHTGLPTLSHARTCVAVRAKNKNKKYKKEE